MRLVAVESIVLIFVLHPQPQSTPNPYEPFLDKSLVTKATSADEVPTAGYMFVEIAKISNHSADACDCQARKLDFGQHKRSCDKKRTRAVMDACWRQCCRNFAPPQDSRG